MALARYPSLCQINTRVWLSVSRIPVRRSWRGWS